MLKRRNLNEDECEALSPQGELKSPPLNTTADEVVSGMSSPDETIVLQHRPTEK